MKAAAIFGTVFIILTIAIAVIVVLFCIKAWQHLSAKKIDESKDTRNTVDSARVSNTNT